MSFVRNTIKAIKIKMMLNRLSKAKENAMREFLGLPPKRSWFEQCYTGCMTAIKDKCCQVFCPCCVYDIRRRFKRPTCWDSAFFKEMLGFLGGAFLTIVIYLLMIYQIGWTPSTAIYVSSVTGLVMTMLLAFSVNMRCFVLLMIPQLFSGKGRMFLLMYALFLVMNHPMKNFNANIMVMSESATCGQEMALNKTKDLVKAAVAPMQSIMKSVKKVLAKVQDFAASLKQVYINCKKVVTEIGAVMKRIAKWLAGIVDRCNEEMGAPYKKCIAAFNYAEGECKKEVPWPASEACGIVTLVGKLCNIARIGELLCLITQAIKDVVVAEFEQPVLNVLDDAARMFDFTVDVSYEFNFTVVQSKSYKQIKEDIKREIVSRMDILIRFVRITEVVMLAAVFFIVIKACVYRTRYLCDERYDNVYITYAVRDLDERRKEVGKEGILPLNNDECGKYVQSNSATMISSEKKKLVLGLFFLFISLFNAGFYMMCDVGLYYVLFIVAKHFSGDSGNMPSPPHTKLHVTGSGPMANMYKSIVSMFDPIAGADVKINAGKCTPIPREPDWAMYDQIGVIYLLCLIMTISESYGLRLRHLIMGCYHPKQERQRAVWLYNHIVKSRGGIIQRARKRMRGVQLGDVAVQHISLRGQLAASFPILERLFKWCGWEVKSCLYCAREGKPDDYMNFVHCAYPDCDAIFCVDCFADLKNICAVCSNPVELQGSDASEEQDSSIDEVEKEKLQIQREYREGRIQQIQEARRPSKVFLGFKEMIDEADSATKEVETSPSESVSSEKQMLGEAEISSEGTDTRQSEESSTEDEMFSRQQPTQNINQNELQIQYGSDAVFSPSSSVCSIDVLSSEEESETASQDINFGAACSKINISTRIVHASDRNRSNRSNDSPNTDIDNSDSESCVSSCSSVDSEDLDYEYQFEERPFARGVEFSSDTNDDDDDNHNNELVSSRTIAYRDKLVTSDIYSESDSDIESSEDEGSEFSEPEEIRLHRT